jgi:Spy/CpxP family protein refolding chaperone
MRLSGFRLAPLFLCASLAALAVAPALRAQDEPPPSGQYGRRGMGGGGGMFMMGGNSAHGTVTAVSGNNITVKDEQGQVYTVETGPNTHFRKDREESKIADIHVGDTIVAAGNLDDQAKTVGAVFVVVLTPEQAAQMQKMRADFGKTWTAGKVTAIKDLTLTIERPDKVSQTLAVDENTAFRKGGRGTAEDITFPDIKVGDRLTARGALQSGTFLATQIAVMPPRQPGQGRFGEGPRGGPGGPPPESPAGTEPQSSASPQN